MADKGKSHISVRLTEAVAIINEAGRTIEAYTYDAKREPKSLLDIEKDRENNRTFILNEKLLHKHTKGRTINGIREIIKEKTGKEPSKDATIRATILTMPINEIKGLNFNLTMQEAVAIEKHNNGEALDAGDEKALESAKEKLIHLNYTPEQMQQIYDWVEAAITAICKVNGIKRSDILYAVLHCNGESSPHLHLGFVPCVYLSNQVNEQGKIIGGSKQAYEDYHKDIEKRRINIQAAIESGATPEEARAMYPVIKRPKTFDGDTNRVITDDEPAYGSSANRFNKYFLKYYLDNIQREMRTLGVETTLRNGHGHTFDVDKKSHAERTEEKFEARIIEMKKIYEAQIEEAKAAQAKATAEMESAQAKAQTMQEEFDSTYATMRSQLQAVKDEKTAAQAEALAAKSQAAEATLEVAKAKEELEVAKRELADAEASAEEAKASLEEYQQDKNQLIKEIKEIKSSLRDFLANIKGIISGVIKNAIKEFLPAWAKATAGEKEEVTHQAKAFVSRNLVKPIEELEAKASMILGTSEKYPVYKAGLFIQTPGKVGFARERIKEAAVGTPYEAEFSMLDKSNFEQSANMMYCINDWFSSEKYTEVLEKMPTEEQIEYMENEARAKRAVQALEMAHECGMDIEVELG